jgi:hypothetical protein
MMVAMARKPQPKKASSDPEEYKRFLETARQLGTDESPESFERAFMKVATVKLPPSKPSGRRSRRSGKPASS